MSASLTFVIPTRNRAELALRAATSLLDGTGDELRVVVSDNSTDEQQAAWLERACRLTASTRLTYLRAPDLTMPVHWNWALEQALARGDTSHYSIHYDRKIAKPGAIRFLLEAIGRHPEHVVTYLLDQVDEQSSRWVLWQTPWTGELYEIETERVVQMASEGRIAEMAQSFPILSNCAVPRAVVEKVRSRFGDICDSTGPDAAFTFRFCALESSYMHLDRALSVIYATPRSNGAGYLSGKATDFQDFVSAWGDRPWLDAVPLAGLNLGWNMLFHEYELVRQALGHDGFPPLSQQGYLDGLAWGLAMVEDPGQRERHTALLESHGWQRPLEDEEPPPGPERTRTVLRRTVAALARRPSMTLLLATALRVKPEHITGFSFRSERRALRFAIRLPRQRVAHHQYLDWHSPLERQRPVGAACEAAASE
jgi:hypothetical protein